MLKDFWGGIKYGLITIILIIVGVVGILLTIYTLTKLGTIVGILVITIALLLLCGMINAIGKKIDKHIQEKII